MKKLFAFTALTICLVGCGNPTLENECNDKDAFLGNSYRELNACKNEYIQKMKVDIERLKHDLDTTINVLKIENEKLKHDLEIFKIKVHYECTNGDSLISKHLN